MFTNHEKLEIDKEIAKFPSKKNACLDALMVIQKSRGYVSDEALESVANYLDMSPTELDGIATFYNLIFRKPVGRNVIRLCDSVSCHILGYEKIRKAIVDEIGIDWGQSSKDGEFTLVPAQCLGACDRAPVMMINDQTYKDVTSDQIREIILSHKKEGSTDEASHREHASRRLSAHPERI